MTTRTRTVLHEWLPPMPGTWMPSARLFTLMSACMAHRAL
jgi:hypothetical protein